MGRRDDPNDACWGTNKLRERLRRDEQKYPKGFLERSLQKLPFSREAVPWQLLRDYV